MPFIFDLALLVIAMVLTPGKGQQAYTGGCGIALEDLPNPASDTCTAFFRCFSNRQYSLRCPLGQAFDFDRSRCRPAHQIDCPLQLQRFQAPAVPHYLRPPQAAQEREVEIRVVHVPAGIDPNNVQVFQSGGQVPGTQVFASAANPAVQQFQAPPQFRTVQGQVFQGQPVQGQPAQPQLVQGQVQGQASSQGTATAQGQGQINIPLFVPSSGLSTQDIGNSEISPS